MESKFSWKRVIGFCGSCIAFYIGAGFATMQEVMQYEASYGSKFWIVIVIAALLYIYTNLSFATNGNRKKIVRGGEIYKIYCGKYIGTFFDYFSAFFCYMCFIVMCGGANSTAMEQWNFPNGVGAIMLAAGVITTAILGLDGILRVLKKLGPIIIFFILFIAVATSIMSADNYCNGLQTIDSGKYEIIQVGNGNPFASGASYGGFVILWFASFLAEIGAKNKLREVNMGMLFSSVAIFGVAAICCVALIANIDITWSADIPTLTLTKMIHPLVAIVFSVIIFLGIFTTSLPLIWTGISKIAKDGTKEYKYFTVVGGIIGCLIACFLPYKRLLNVLYGLNGYLGFVLVAFMIVSDLRKLKKTLC